jgi:uncharacterized membrane protein (UPF0127 family)
VKRVINERNKNILSEQTEIASTMYERLLGLMGRSEFPNGRGMLIKRSGNSIHTFFMKFPIDVAFINKSGEVKDIKTEIKPWRMVFAKTVALTDCLELPAGTLAKTDTKIGDILRVET